MEKSVNMLKESVCITESVWTESVWTVNQIEIKFSQNKQGRI